MLAKHVYESNTNEFAKEENLNAQWLCLLLLSDEACGVSERQTILP